MRGRRFVTFLVTLAAMAGITLLVDRLVTRLVAGRETLTFHIGGHLVELLAPRWLACLALVPYLAMVATGSLTDFARPQRALSLAVRALFAASLVVALARPSLVTDRQVVATVVLVDASDSVSDRQLDEARRLVESLRAERRRRESEARDPEPPELRLVVFAGRPHVVALPPDGTPLPPSTAGWRPAAFGEKGDATDLEAALRLSYGLYPPGVIRRALLLSDGNQTQGDLLAEADAARARGLRLDVHRFAEQHDDEVLVRELRLPPPGSVRLGAPFEVEADVYASRATNVTLTLFQDGVVSPQSGVRELMLEAGKNRVSFRASVKESGFATFKLVASGFAGDFHDRFASNNQAVASLAVKGRPKVLYIEGEPSSAGYLMRALQKENIEVESRGPYGMPTRAADLAKYDLALVSDVPASAFGPDQTAAMETYVRELGGGFLMTGGENSFGSGGYGGTRVERLLPVRFDMEKKRDQPSLALILAIDRSGSMQGEKLELAKDAAKASAELLAGDDLIGVVAFDAQAQPIVRLQRAANRVRIVSDISRLSAGGGTNILAPLQEAYQELAPARAKVKHVILLTDGQASYEGIADLVEEMAEAKITVSAVGVGVGADKTLLTMIAERGGGRFYFTQDATNVPKIFTKETTEVARSSLVEEAIRPRVAKHVELLDGVGIEGAPFLRGYATTKPKPLSEVILVSDTAGDPLLARWRVGLGQTAVWTSDVKNRWAVEWMSWPGYARFFAQLVRSTMRHRSENGGEAGYTLSADVDAPHVHVAVDAVGADDHFVNGLETTLEVLDPARATPLAAGLGHTGDASGSDGGKARGVLQTTRLAESAAGRYEGDFTLDRYGSFLLRAVHRQSGRVVAETSGSVSVPYPREYLALPPDETLLRRAAQVTRGRYAPSPSEIFDPGEDKVAWHHDRWQPLLYLAVALLLADVLFRRVRLFGYRRQRARV